MEYRRTLRIVLASPADVTEERDVVAAVVSELGGICRDMDPPLAWELWRWESDSYPGLHLEGPQGIIDDRLRIEQCDVLIGVFRRRFGTPVTGAGSGTEHEIRAAINAWRGRGAPQVMIYFAEYAEDKNVPQDEQWQKVQHFKRELMEKEKTLIGCFQDPESLQRQVRRHLMQFALGLHRTGPENGLVHVSWQPEPVKLRGEGHTELLGTFFVEMTYQGRNPPTSSLYVIVFLYLNTAITCRPRDPILFEVGRPGSNIYLSATTLERNHVAFPAFRLNGMLPGETRRFHISNLRCNAQPMPAVHAFLAVAGGAVEKENQLVATVTGGLRFDVLRLGRQERNIGGILKQSVSLSPTRVATLRFTEGFPYAFKVQTPVYGGVSRVGATAVYGSESGCFGMILSNSSGQAVLTNLADFGTRFEASFHNLPVGVRLFVTDSDDGFDSSIGARLVRPEGTLGEGTCEIEGRTACELVVQEGSAVAVWQVISAADRSPSVVFLDFGVFVAYEACPASNSPLPGTTTVNGSFSPTLHRGATFGFSASRSALPIPRFCAPTVAAASLFQIVLS